ncbi:AGE family epimerase/isomerase [Echinicola sp. CAU 1574]|uniref:AGE family epimerase/isomerase n=1 Tax=Echinicola arenosa TaxID=2774144 RepID=A0ABR9AF86_9BACT|nr:AGE family epimerase/isomerase [Echinicola arenosa]MBD8487357.1 AGE family epimerase/isomerase [Echinicola arenosa]
MDKNKICDYGQQYKTALLENVIPFWERNSPDWENGGYFTCLDRNGKVFDTDKFVWLQGRQAWMFSLLYQEVDKREEWLAMSRLGIDFLTKHGCDGNGDYYFSLTQKGSPLVQPYNIFSDCFVAMAFAKYGQISGNENLGRQAVSIFQRILDRQENPKGRYNKAYPGTRSLKNFALPMILSNLCLEMEPLLDNDLVEGLLDTCVQEVMVNFLDQDTLLMFENRTMNNGYSDSFEGRLLNPGHAIEAMWFMMDIAKRRGDQSLANKAVTVMLRQLENGWDKEYGGIFYFLDHKGHPPQQLEWDQKLWWVHLETLVALAKGYRMTGDRRCWEWFETVHQYAWGNFYDEKEGEWFGYLNRRGDVLLDLKGGKWKGCFHVPRALYQIWKTLETR